MQKKTLILELSRHNLQGTGSFYAALELPAKAYELTDALQRLRLSDITDTGFEVSIMSCPPLRSLEDRRLDAPTLAELNFLAKRLAGLSATERDVLEVVERREIDSWDETEPLSMKDIINLTYGLEKVRVMPWIKSDRELGAYVIENGLQGDIAEIPEKSRYLLDEKRIGGLQRANEGGAFVGNKYIVAGEYKLPNIYDGTQLPEEESDTEDYVFRLEITKAAESDAEAETQSGAWINLPIDKATANAVANAQGKARIEDCIYLDFESSVLQIESECFGNMEDFDTLNALAEGLKKLSFADQIKFKAILEAEQPRKISAILDVLENLPNYELNASVDTSQSFFREYLKQHLDVRIDPSWTSYLYIDSEGTDLLRRLGATVTDYGIISARGRSLFEPVVRYSPENLSNEKFDVIELFGQTALFTYGRIFHAEVPQGLYKYELRAGAEGTFAGVETQVAVNHGGTVLTKLPLDLGKKGYRVFDEDSSPNFLGEEMGIKEFLDRDFEQSATRQTIGGLEP